MASATPNGKRVFVRCIGATVANQTRFQQEINALARLGVSGPRFGPSAASIEPTRGGARSWTGLDASCAKILAAGFSKVQFGLYYGVTGTSWATADTKNPLVADNAYLKDLYFAILDRMVQNGFALSDMTAEIWNEWDGTVGGGDGTNANANVMQWLRYFVPLLKAAYPTLGVIGPTFATSTGMNATNISAGFKTDVSANYPGGYAFSFYPSGSNMAIPWSSWEYAQYVYSQLDSNIALLESLDTGCVGQYMHVSESSTNQSRLGFTTSSWMKRGGLALEAEYVTQMFSAMLNHPRLQTVSWYEASNDAGSSDARSSGLNYGILDNATSKPFKERYLALGRACGLPMVEATELAYWGSWATEPSG